MNKEKIKSILHMFLLDLRLFAKECLLPAAILNLLIEGFSRQSFWKPFVYLFTRPHIFLYNAFLIAISLSLCFLFKRRRFVCYFISALWLTVGVTDFVLLQFRTTPFTAVDFLLLDSAFSIMKHYLNVFQIVLIAIAIVAAIAAGVVMFLRSKKATEGTGKPYAGALFVVLVVSGLLFTKIFMATGILERNFGNLAQSFHKNGLPFCFYASIFGTGISRPSTYSEDEIDRIVSSLTTPTAAPTHKAPTAAPTDVPTDIPTPSVHVPSQTPASSFTITDATGNYTGDGPIKETAHPNFVFLQLESFFDPNRLNTSRYSKNPIPTFTRLLRECPSGYFTVPSIGAGTANTEFEILTGMNLDFFGPGEYPYKTILKEVPCESLAYNLSRLGLKTHAIHNNDGTFYSRHKVFSQLGFDTFTPIEYMGTYETTPLGWAKDSILTEEIMKSLRSTKEQDLVYTISVQGHGAYPTEPLIDNPSVIVRWLPEELEESYYGIQYFVNQLYEMDTFVAELLAELSTFEEEVVLVIYGDHLPSFPFVEESMDGSLFQTQYVIWNNHKQVAPMERTLEAYELSAYVLDCYDIHEGLFTLLHQKHQENQDEYTTEQYLTEMEMLEYDALYGPHACYEDGIIPYTPTNLQFGVDKIEIHNVILQAAGKDKNVLYVNGVNFTPYSIVYINDEACSTTYLSDKTLSVSDSLPSEPMSITVAQVGTDSFELSFTEPLVFDGTETPVNN